MTREEAVQLGKSDGENDAATLAQEHGMAVIRTMVRTGQSWSEEAINSGAAAFRKVPTELRDDYYQAFQDGASARARELADEYPEPKRG